MPLVAKVRGGGKMTIMSHIQLIHNYDTIMSLDNLLLAWNEFKVGKKSRKDVQEFERNLMTNIISLHQDLANKTYKHSEYEAFKISDPKPRDIHKAKVWDRLLHHAIYRVLYPFFDRTFIADSYSCRVNKGTHKAINRFRKFAFQVSKNHTRTAWVLKCDIKKFFANIDHNILKIILSKCLFDTDVLWLLSQVIDSFSTQTNVRNSAIAENVTKGLPLGNLTSQLLVNIYMNEFDQFVKKKLKVKYYIRYADDFVILSEDKNYLEHLVPKISCFLEQKLKLQLHPGKIFIKTLASGIDFLGWVHFTNHRVLRTSTKRKMIRKLKNNQKPATVQSYLGLLKHGNTEKLERKIKSYQD